MKAIAICPVCKKQLTTNCKGCIDLNEAPHICNGKTKIVKVKWKVYPENEKEIMEMENKL